MHTSACFKIVNKCKISKFARFKFKDFSSTFKHFICFQPLSRALKFLFQIQGFLKHAMNPEKCMLHCYYFDNTQNVKQSAVQIMQSDITRITRHCGYEETVIPA